METQKDFWHWAAVLVGVIAMLNWALATTLNIGGASALWTSGVLFMLAIGSIAFRVWLKYRHVVWTEELKEAHRHRVKQTQREMLSLLLFSLGNLVLTRLVLEGLLPQCVSSILSFALLLLSIWLWRAVRRSVSK